MADAREAVRAARSLLADRQAHARMAAAGQAFAQLIAAPPIGP
ncbi:MAG: hypothetical protein R3E68_20355 [Burkholderiaceae bacterium]